MANNLITKYFETDHDRLDFLFTIFQTKKKESASASKPYFRAFYRGLKRHIVWEEDVLFPLFEKKSGMANSGPTFVMREEHREIGALLERIHEKVRKAELSSDEDEARLLEILGAHNQKEEQVLYPAVDQLLSAEETAAAFLGIEEIPEDRYHTCCGVH